MNQLNTKSDPRLSLPNPMDSGWYRTIPLAAVILSFAVVAFYWGTIDGEVPLHWGLDGEINAYRPKTTLWILPLLNLGLFYLLGAAPKLPIEGFTYPVSVTPTNAVEQHRIGLDILAQVRLVCCLLLAYLTYVVTLIGARGEDAASITGLYLLLGLLFVVIGWGLYRSYRAG